MNAIKYSNFCNSLDAKSYSKNLGGFQRKVSLLKDGIKPVKCRAIENKIEINSLTSYQCF